MGLGVYFGEDVAKILTALSSAGDRYGPEYHKALSDVALALGVHAPTLTINAVMPNRHIIDDQTHRYLDVSE